MWQFRKMLWTSFVMLFLFISVHANAQKLSNSISWNITPGVFSARPPIGTSILNFAKLQAADIVIQPYGLYNGIQVVYSTGNNFNFGAQLTSAYWPASKNAYGDLRVHQFTRLANVGCLVYNKNLSTFGIEAVLGRGGTTTDIYNMRLIPENGPSAQTITMKSTTVGASLLAQKFFSEMPQNPSQTMHSALETGLKLGYTFTIADYPAFYHDTHLIFISVSIGGAVFKTAK